MAGKAGDYYQEDSQGGDDGRGEGCRCAPQSANDRIDYENTRNEDEKQVDDSGPNALRGRRANLRAEARNIRLDRSLEGGIQAEDAPIKDEKPEKEARVGIRGQHDERSDSKDREEHYDDTPIGRRQTLPGDRVHAETSNPPNRPIPSAENLEEATISGVSESPAFGLLSSFHEEGEQSYGQKEKEESAENPVDHCIGQSKVQSYRNGGEDVGCGHEDKKRDDHPSSRPALLVEKRPRQTSLVIQRPHAETSIAPCQESPSGRESPGFESRRSASIW